MIPSVTRCIFIPCPRSHILRWCPPFLLALLPKNSSSFQNTTASDVLNNLKKAFHTEVHERHHVNHSEHTAEAQVSLSLCWSVPPCCCCWNPNKSLMTEVTKCNWCYCYIEEWDGSYGWVKPESFLSALPDCLLSLHLYTLIFIFIYCLIGAMGSALGGTDLWVKIHTLTNTHTHKKRFVFHSLLWHGAIFQYIRFLSSLFSCYFLLCLCKHAALFSGSASH